MTILTAIILIFSFAMFGLLCWMLGDSARHTEWLRWKTERDWGIARRSKRNGRS